MAEVQKIVVYYVIILALQFVSAMASKPYESTGADSEELDPKDVEEPGCPKITHLKHINLREIMGEWHLPYMSSHWIRYMAKRMHGKFMKKSSMGKACVKMHVLPIPEEQVARNENASVWIHSKCPRTGAELNLACSPSEANNAKWKCHTKDSEDPEGDSWVYVVDTNEKDWALVVRCFPNNGMNWAIFSKQKMLDSKLVKSLLKEVEELGFKLFNVVEVPYEKCMTP